MIETRVGCGCEEAAASRAGAGRAAACVNVCRVGVRAAPRPLWPIADARGAWQSSRLPWGPPRGAAEPKTCAAVNR